METLVSTTDNEVTEAIISRSGQQAVTRRVNRPTVFVFIGIDVYHEAIARHRQAYIEELIRERSA
jgi:hypothetical protein